MSHNYLFSTYDDIDQRLRKIEPRLTQSQADEDTRQYAAGQIDVLCEFQRFLGNHFDIKLPKRLRNQRMASPAVCQHMANED